MIFQHEDFEIEVIQSSYTLNSTDNPPYDYILNPFSEDEYFHEYNFYEIILNRYFMGLSIVIDVALCMLLNTHLLKIIMVVRLYCYIVVNVMECISL